ncbi:hypothetical protein [Aquimarina macrocephali]|uniref:hypothetical protein n=1 Tax=Aquimarina macrocephali TaxID=666563 RepID=UPI003F680227
MENIKEAVKKGYGNLPDGGKKRAADIYGALPVNFKKIVNGDYKDESVYYVAFNAIQQAAKDCKKDTDEKVSRVLSIEVVQPETVEK